MSDLKNKIAHEIYVAMERLGADIDLLAVVGSYGDTLDDGEVLQLLRDYNETGVILHAQH